jgi:hypothetical protein
MRDVAISGGKGKDKSLDSRKMAVRGKGRWKSGVKTLRARQPLSYRALF